MFSHAARWVYRSEESNDISAVTLLQSNNPEESTKQVSLLVVAVDNAATGKCRPGTSHGVR